MPRLRQKYFDAFAMRIMPFTSRDDFRLTSIGFIIAATAPRAFHQHVMHDVREEKDFAMRDITNSES